MIVEALIDVREILYGVPRWEKWSVYLEFDNEDDMWSAATRDRIGTLVAAKAGPDAIVENVYFFDVRPLVFLANNIRTGEIRVTGW